MRGYYLRTTNYDESGGCRGGIGSGDDYGDSYALEIGVKCNADEDMMALAVHVDEVTEFLALSPSPLASMLVKSIREVKEALEKQLSESQARNREEREKAAELEAEPGEEGNE